MAEPRLAALFDMDHTVLRVDSSMSWMRFLRRRGEISSLFALRALWWGLQYKLALLDIDALADRVAGDLRGGAEAEMLAKVAQWSERELSLQINPEAREAIARHRAQGHLIALLTGGGQYAARSVAGLLGIEHVLSTEVEVHNAHFTGRLAQRCFGPHKVVVAERWAAAQGVDLQRATFYSDSYNDLPMLSRVGRPVVVNPDVRLRRHANDRGWAIQAWG